MENQFFNVIISGQIYINTYIEYEKFFFSWYNIVTGFYYNKVILFLLY